MRPITILQVPYDSGHRDFRMGRGPGRLLETGLAERLREAGREVDVEAVELEPATVIEPGTTFALLRALAPRIRAVSERGHLPLVLSGNCITSLATTAGVAAGGPLGVVWFDAHGDLNTPETTPSGFLDGMALATLLGRCWQGLAGAIEGFVPIADDRLLLIAMRDLDSGERELIRTAGLRLVRAEDVGADGQGRAIGSALEDLRERVDRIYLHLDIDVVDPRVARPNHFAAPGGLTLEQLEGLIAAIAARFEVAAAALTAYDPQCDAEDRVVAAVRRLTTRLAREVG